MAKIWMDQSEMMVIQPSCENKMMVLAFCKTWIVQMCKFHVLHMYISRPSCQEVELMVVALPLGGWPYSLERQPRERSQFEMAFQPL